MKAVVLAAEIDAGLGNSRTLNLPKILLRFGARSLLQRHIDILKRYGIKEPIHDVLLTSERETFGFEDVTGLSWIEIDYSVDVEPANAGILPRLSASTRHASFKAVTDGAMGRMSNHE